MKNILFSTLVLLFPFFCTGQTVSVKIKIENGSLVTEPVEASKGDKIIFDIAAIPENCAATLSLKFKRNGENVAHLDWEDKNERKEIFMAQQDISMDFMCGDLKGNGIIKLKQPPPPPPPLTGSPATIATGNTVQDALQISDWWKTYLESSKKDTSAQNKSIRLLQYYKITGNAFDKINYLESYKDLKIGDPQSTQVSGVNTNASTQASSAPASLSGIFSPTLVIDALGKFAAKRFKEELTIAFLKKFRDTLMSKQYMELRLLMPRTFHTFVTADVFNYAQFYQSLHENAQTDLYDLPENTAAMLRYRQNNTDAEKHLDRQLYEPLMAALDLIRVLELKMPAATAVELLASRDYIDIQQQTAYGNIARTLGVFSKHLHSWKDATATGWADEQYLARLVSDEDAFNFWMALVMKQEEKQLREIVIQKSADPKAPDISLYDLLNNQVFLHQSYLRETFARFSEVQASAKNLITMSKADSLSKTEAFSKYGAASFGLLMASLEFIKQADPRSIKPDYNRAIHLLKTGQDLAAFSHGKRFGDGVSVLLEIVKLIYGVDALDIEGPEMKLPLCTKRSEMLDLLRLIDKYGNLLVSCANAQSSDELLAILEKTASPVQSYLKKRGAGRITASINMYPGLALGHEYQLDKVGKFTTKGGTVIAFTTPIGLSLDFGICKKSSLSVFASFLDIGAVTAFRLQDNASRLPELKWKNVFAPGAYLMFGIGGTPLALGLGGQYGPALRNVEVNAGTPNLEEASHFRAGITLTVDVPAFMVNIRAKKK